MTTLKKTDPFAFVQQKYSWSIQDMWTSDLTVRCEQAEMPVDDDLHGFVDGKYVPVSVVDGKLIPRLPKTP